MTTLQSIIAAKADLLSTEDTATLLGLSPKTLAIWRSTGRYKLPFIKVGHNVRYRRTEVLAWLEGRARPSGTTP